MKIKIVGGGIIGLTTAVVLDRYNEAIGREASIEIIEKSDSVGSKSTTAAGCGLRTVYKHPANVELARKGIQFWKNASEILEEPIGFRENGYVFLTNSSKKSETFQSEGIRQESYGIPTGFHSPPESIPNTPDISYQNYQSLLYSPHSSLADPKMMVRSLRETAINRGIEISVNKKVLGIDGKQNPNIRLENEKTSADILVNATGAWANNIARMVDDSLPIWSVRRRLAHMDLKGDTRQPLIVDSDTGIYFLTNSSGDVLAGGNLEDKDRFDADSNQAFTNRVTDEWLEKFGHNSKRLWSKLSDADVEESWTGLYTMTESRIPIVERDKDILHMTGFSGHGIMQAPGAAMFATRLISDDNLQSDMVTSLSSDRQNMQPDIQF